MDTIDKVLEFHVAFGVPAPSSVRVDPVRAALRLKLQCEELAEVADALGFVSFASALKLAVNAIGTQDRAPDVLNVLQELTDMQYVLDGSFVEFGLDAYKEAAFAEVHRANMSKLGPNGRPVLRADGKVLKGPNFSPADMQRVVSRRLLAG